MKRLKLQNLFCFISLLFIMSCCIFYGTRFIKLFIENKKVEIAEENSLIKVVKENNEDNELLKPINGTTYFTGKSDNNYVMYSNILWRIIKLNDDNSVTMISDKAVTSLAFGEAKKIDESVIYKWLNNSTEEYSGILENALNKPTEYLQKDISCNDVLDELSNNPCKEEVNDSYISLLSVIDYLNIGSKDSYLNNKEYYYLNNTNSKSQAWYVTDSGTTSLTSGNDIIGIRPVVTIKANIDYVSGDGSKTKPYMIEDKSGLFGSYVKLGEDIWRIYQINDKDVRLVLNDYLKVNGENLKYIYSKSSSYHDDTKYGSIAYYLNHDFLNSLSYKDKIQELSWSNGYYSSSSDWDYTTALKSTIETKVTLMSIGDIIVNPDLGNYFTTTGTSNKGGMVYSITDNKKLFAKSISSSVYVVPTISLDKELLTKGNGTKDSPFEME